MTTDVAEFIAGKPFDVIGWARAFSNSDYTSPEETYVTYEFARLETIFVTQEYLDRRNAEA